MKVYTQVHNYLKLNSVTEQSCYYGYDHCLGHVVKQLVEGLRYRTGHGFDSRWCHCNFSLT